MAIEHERLSARVPATRSASAMVAVLASVGDPEGTRTVTSIIVLLVALGLALVMVAVWLHRATRPDPELLAPLEVMGERKWRRADPVWQRRRLDELRPAGATPLEPSIAPPDVDEAFDRGPSASGFDDLHDVSLEAPSPNGGHPDTPAAEPSEASERQPSGANETPQATQRPDLDLLPEADLDPEILAAAQAELDAELGSDQS